MWTRAEVLFQPEQEALQMLCDAQGWSTVRHVYINKKLKAEILNNAILSAVAVDRIMEWLYIKKERE